MMIYKLFITEDGRPRSGLSPVWQSLHSLDGTDKTAWTPAVSEIGGGWYKFQVVYGVNPFTSPELVGVIDAGAELADGVESIRNDADTADELRIELSQSGNVEYRRIRT